MKVIFKNTNLIFEKHEVVTINNIYCLDERTPSVSDFEDVSGVTKEEKSGYLLISTSSELPHDTYLHATTPKFDVVNNHKYVFVQKFIQSTNTYYPGVQVYDNLGQEVKIFLAGNKNFNAGMNYDTCVLENTISAAKGNYFIGLYNLRKIGLAYVCIFDLGDSTSPYYELTESDIQKYFNESTMSLIVSK